MTLIGIFIGGVIGFLLAILTEVADSKKKEKK
jgi:gas vesicle protein